MQSITFITLLLTLVSLSAAHGYKRCLETPPSEDFRTKSANVESKYSRLDHINIKTFVHVVTTQAKKGNYSLSQVRKQIAQLNKGYKKSAISFTLASTDFTVNNAWAKSTPFDTQEIRMKYKLHKGTYADLNLYFLSDLDDNKGLLGNCPMPETNIHPGNSSDIQEFYKKHDGCVILADSMPGGNAAPFNLGATATHEVGHYLGGFHVFSGDCSKGGDGVADTPPQKTPTEGCPKFKNSCAGGGPDSIHNFLDYSDDRCLNQYTPGQARLFHSNYNRFRACNGACN